MTRTEKLLIIIFGLILSVVSTLLIFFYLLPLSDIYQGLEANNNLVIMGVVFYGLEIIIGIILIFWGLFFGDVNKKFTKIVWIIGGVCGFLMIPAFYFFVLNNIYSMIDTF